jgi:type VI secretion system protein ImpJ
MKDPGKVVWSEGMFLTPQLFQQSDLHHEAQLHFRLSRLHAYPWGMAELAIDQDAVTNGMFTVTRCACVLLDGLVLNAPADDPAPASRAFRDAFPATADRLAVYLAVPEQRAGAVNVAAIGASTGRPMRYAMGLVKAVDDTTEGSEREIPVARKNVRLLVSGESLEGHVTIKIAEVVRTPSGTFALDEGYVAPALTLASSPRLLLILRRIVELVAAKGASLAQQRRHVADFGASDLATFWLLHTLNVALPALQHLVTAPERHPELAYLELARLIGMLTTFSLETEVREIPRYDHEALGPLFAELERKIVFLLETVIPTRYVMIPLEKTADHMHVGRVVDERLVKSARFYLGASAQLPVARIVSDIPTKAKIGSPDQIGDLIARALLGVELTHEPVPPTAVPAKPGFKYFQLGRQGRWWEAVARTRGVAIYLPDEFPDLRLELIAVKE